MELENVKNQLMKWLGERFIHYKEEDCTYIDKKTNRVIMKLYTDNNSYTISAKSGFQGKNNLDYLGCTVSSRKSRTGEDWNRGSDLADGSFCYETWINIISDIVRYELVGIHRPIKLHYE